MRKKFLLGLVAMLLPWTAWAQTATITNNAEIEYDGGQTQPEFEVKLANGNPLELNEGYTVEYTYTPADGIESSNGTCTSVKGAGTYKATIYGAGNFAGLIKVEVVEPIVVSRKELKNVKLTSTQLIKKYGEEDSSIDLNNAVVFSTVSGEGLITGIGIDAAKEREDAIRCLTLLPTEYNGVNAGEVRKVLVGGEENPNSNYFFNGQKGDETAYQVTITPRELEVVLNNSGHVYRLNPVSLAWLANKGNKAFTFEGDGVLKDDEDKVTIELKDKNNPDLTSLKDAGVYELEATITSTDENILKNYTIVESPTYTISKAKLEIVAKEEGTEIEGGKTVSWSKEYDGKDLESLDLTDQFEITGIVEGDAITDDDIKLSLRKQGKNAGTAQDYYVVVYCRDMTTENEEAVLVKQAKYATALKNYEIVYDQTQQQYTIEPRDLTKEESGVEIGLTDDKYQGQVFSLNVTDEKNKEINLLSVTYGEKILKPYDAATEAGDYVLLEANTEEAKNAGSTFTVKIEGKNNYKGEMTGNFKITKAPLTIEPKNATALTKVYDGKDVENSDLTSQFTFTGLVGDDDKDPVTVFSMKKNAGANVVEGGYWVNVYDSEGKLVDPAQYTSKEVTKGHPNYVITFNRSSCKYVITKKLLTYHIAEATRKYNGYATPLPSFTVASDDFVDADLDEKGNVKAGVFTEAPKVELTESAKANVGEYDLEVTNIDKVEAKNYEVTYTTAPNDGKGKYKITKADLDLTILPQEIDYNTEEEADLEIKFEYGKNKIEGATVHVDGTFRTSDKDAVEALLKDHKLVYSKEGIAQQVGLHEGGLTLDVDHTTLELQNFIINFTAGDLLVNALHEITLDRDAVDDPEKGTKSVKTWLEAYNGVEEMTVILGGNRNLQADYWYTLVLPFDVKVRDISKAFGYAVVDVPNEANTQPEVVSFKLKVDAEPIKANTLMLIKIDQKINLGDAVGTDDEVKFEGVTINYDPTYYVEDGGQNVYQGVYEKTPLNESAYWFLYQGTFMNAGTNPTTILPLGGYVKATAGNNARILIEEADGSTTTINAITGETSNSADSWYSIGGMKMNAQPTQKGVYINNGKKVVIK